MVVAEAVARMGVEYRNDLLGHVHGLGPSAAPSAYDAGFERSDAPRDWPPTSTPATSPIAGGDRRLPGPVFQPFPDDGTLRRSGVTAFGGGT